LTLHSRTTLPRAPPPLPAAALITSAFGTATTTPTIGPSLAYRTRLRSRTTTTTTEFVCACNHHLECVQVFESIEIPRDHCSIVVARHDQRPLGRHKQRTNLHIIEIKTCQLTPRVRSSLAPTMPTPPRLASIGLCCRSIAKRRRCSRRFASTHRHQLPHSVVHISAD
jgi:hypothetical protein